MLDQIHAHQRETTYVSTYILLDDLGETRSREGVIFFYIHRSISLFMLSFCSHNVPHSLVSGVGVDRVLGQQVGQQLEGVLVVLVLLDARRDHRVAQRLEHPCLGEGLSLLAAG